MPGTVPATPCVSTHITSPAVHCHESSHWPISQLKPQNLRPEPSSSGSQGWKTGGLGFKCRGVKLQLTLSWSPHSHLTSRHRKPSTAGPSLHHGPMAPAPVDVGAGRAPLLLGAGFGLSGRSQTDGFPQPGLAPKFLHAGPKHNTI